MQYPGKELIVPVHQSDRGTFRRCRRRWNWSSPMRNNLRTRADISGVSMPLWFGSGIHYALEQYYHPAVKRDPVEAFIEWFELQWNGGDTDDPNRSYDPFPKAIGEWATGFRPDGAVG